MDWLEHITVDPEICHGRACITGTRVLATVVLDNLAAGLSPEEIAQSYPSITIRSVQATMCYAAELAKERVVALPGWDANPQSAVRFAVSDVREHSKEPQCG